MDKQFRLDILKGLTSSPKYIPSKYFYDETGDELFQQIMELDDYYLTDAEFEILSENKEDLLSQFNHNCDHFHLIEFGAGDGYKTKTLLSHLTDKQVDFEYNPIDISENAIDSLVQDLERSNPLLDVEPYNMEYDSALDVMQNKDSCRNVILFLGSNIGNFLRDEAIEFLKGIYQNLKPGDLLLTGFDLKKDPDKILAAYNDSEGITRKFNLNLLERINRELGADFDPDGFYHCPEYDKTEGAAKSYLISRRDQVVRIDSLDIEVSFKLNEPVFTEISQKYDMEMIEEYADQSGFNIRKNYFDKRKYFVDSLWEKQ